MGGVFAAYSLLVVRYRPCVLCFMSGVPGPSLEEALLSAAGKERAVAEALPPDAIQVGSWPIDAASSAVHLQHQARVPSLEDGSCAPSALHLVLGSTRNEWAIGGFTIQEQQSERYNSSLRP
jgi:hypothetical protein